MIRLSTFTPRMWLILAHDLLATAAAVVASFFIRFEEAGLAERWRLLVIVLPIFVVASGFVYAFSGLYKAKWRFTSLPDLFNIVRAATVLAAILLALDYVLLAPNFYGTFFFGKITIVLYWLLQIAFLSGPRIAYRYFRYTRTLHHAKVERVGPDPGARPRGRRGRAAARDRERRGDKNPAGRHPLAVDGRSGPGDPRRVGAGRSRRHRSASSRISAAAGTNVTRLVLTPSALDPEAKPETILMRAKRLGLATSRLPSLDDGGEALRLAPVNVEDLLLRPGVKIDYRRLEGFVKGKSIIVTGGGGSIGAEICDRIVTFGAARVLVIENSEPALHAVLETLGDQAIRRRGSRGALPTCATAPASSGWSPISGPTSCSTRRRSSMCRCSSGTGGRASRPTCSARSMSPTRPRRPAPRAMVMISTDKAIEPVSVLGASKRFAEMYCQALDSDFARRGNAHQRGMRLIAVRFGNVLASNGSVVPKFKAQIEAGGPVTVTHPEMVRYFMTIREACDLVVTAASHAVGSGHTGVAVYVLNMGQPVKIVDLAERMIRLSGLEPGRDIDITFTGIRPGERLHEILFAREEPTAPVGIDGIVAAKPVSPSIDAMRGWLAALEQGLAREDRSVIYNVLRDAVPDFGGQAA